MGKIDIFIFQDDTFFSAELDNGGVRVGMIGIRCFDIPKNHAAHNRVLMAETREQVETIFDECMSGFVAHSS